MKIKIDSRCRIAAGLFSYSGVQEIEAQEIEGEIAYGIKKLLPKEEELTPVDEIIELNGKNIKN